MSIAIRIARAYSNKDKVAFSGYHGWSDWYLATNLASSDNLNNHLFTRIKHTRVPRTKKKKKKILRSHLLIIV